VEAPDGWHKATFDILAVTFGDNGVPVDQISRTHTVSLKGDSYEQALRRGILYNLFVPIKKPGAYQLRTVLRDITSNRVGSANQFIEVPDINKHRLTMSGILVMATSREVLQKSNQQLPQATEADNSSQSADARGTIAYRQFRRGQVMEYGFVIYNAKTDKASGRPLLLSQVRVFKAGKIVSAGKELPFDATGQQDLRRLVAGGALQLGIEMDPGEYVLQILVTDQLVKRKHRVTSQWIDFVIVE
jgi:hypothetical protein